MNKRKTIRPVNLQDTQDQSRRLRALINGIRDQILAPEISKEPPTLTVSDLASLCGVEKPKFVYEFSRRDLPPGQIQGNRKVWTLKEARQITRSLRSEQMRPEKASAVTITVANFKGGVSKTTTTVSLAQGLAMRGHKVLVVDLDPQGSATNLFGIVPTHIAKDDDEEIQGDDVEKEKAEPALRTAADLFSGAEEDLKYAVLPTYFDGVDLVGASPELYAAEFTLPARQVRDPGFAFWQALDAGLEELRPHYDVIVIDTPPSMSYVTINSLFAAEGVVMPIPPSALDFASSAQFWDFFYELMYGLFKTKGVVKVFEFVDVLLARVEANDATNQTVRKWIFEGYQDKVLPVEIPKTSVVGTSSAQFGTVYDIARGAVQAKTLLRARDAYDRMVEAIELQINEVWLNRMEALKTYEGDGDGAIS